MRKIYAGLFIVALTTLMYEILLTRIFSVTLWYHYAFIAISIAMFGLSLGSTLVHVFKHYFREEVVRQRLTLMGLMFGISMPVSFIIYLAIPVSPSSELEVLYQLLILGAAYLVVVVPFVLGGIITCLVLTRFPKYISTLYAADLTGAALGCIALIYLLNQTTGPTAVLIISGIAALSALFFLDKQKVMRSAAIAASLFLLVCGVWNGYLTETGSAPFALRYVKGIAETGTLYEKWNSYSRVTVSGDENARTRAFGWGLSEKLPANTTIQSLLLLIDSVAGTPLTKFSGDLRDVDFLKYDIVNLAHYLRNDARVLVIGVGGGRDILSALAFKQKEIVGVEVNKAIVDVLTKHYGDFTGHLDRYPNVKIINDEARSYISHSQEKFDIIQISLIDTWAATAAGAFVFTENSLYTVEAWNTFFDHITDNGVLAVSRWYYRDRPGEMYRLTSLASEVLRKRGVVNPRDHIIIVRKMKVTPEAQEPDGVGTMLVSKEAFSESDIAMIKKVSNGLGFEVVFTPAESLDPTFTALSGHDAPAVFLSDFPININPPTDDNPFFFHMLRFRDFANPAQWELGRTSFNMKAVATLLILLFITILFAAFFIVLPLLFSLRLSSVKGIIPLISYFGSIGIGFMLIEVTLLQRLIIYLGNPVYSLSVVLFSLLLSGGIGSFITRNLNTETVFVQGRKMLAALILALCVMGIIAQVVIATYYDVSLPLRILISVLLVSGMGTLMGMAFPVGVKVVSLSSQELMPFLWSINGATSVVASVLAVVISITAGIPTAFQAGIFAYIVAFFALMSLSRKFRPS